MYGNDWQDNKDGTFTSTGGEKYYSALDLYLMGLYDKLQVPQMLLIENAAVNPAKLPEVGTTITGTSRFVTIDDIIAAEGERVPNASASQKTFKTAFILITAPNTYSGDELSGIENIRNAWAGRFAQLTGGKGSILDVPPSISISVSSPSNGDTITGPDVTVKGAVINTTRNEMGVTVNGVVATIYGSQFIATHVPLIEGANTISITATDTEENTASTSVTVNAVAGDYIRLTSNIESGILPLEVTLRIDGSFSIENSSMSVTGPTAIELLENSSPDEYRIKITTEGIYNFTANVTGPDGNIYEDTLVITVMNKEQLDRLLKAKWEGMKGSVMSGDIETSISYFISPSQDRYRQKFVGLSFAQIYSIFSSVVEFRVDTLRDATAECSALRSESGSIYSYPVTFVSDGNGIWKLMGF